MPATSTSAFPPLDLRIVGIGVKYPEHELRPEGLKEFALRHYPRTPALEKTLAVNEHTGIEKRNTIMPLDHPLVNQHDPPSIDQISDIFLKEGVRLAAGAARQAIAEWGGEIPDITHIVSVTCTNTANPGFDHYVARELGLSSHIQRALLHGVGCAGGLAALRTAANLAVAATFLQRPARILVVACDLNSLLYRSELDSITKSQQTLVGVTLFSDCASALVISNGFEESPSAFPESIYDILAWDNFVVPGTDQEIGMDAHPHGWKGRLSPRVPSLSSSSVGPLFSSLISRAPPAKYAEPEEFDWALHPGGLKIVTSVQKELNLTPEHLRASYDVYKNHGNSSGPTVISVLDRLRQQDMQGNGRGKEHVVACAFGPGITVEMILLKKPVFP